MTTGCFKRTMVLYILTSRNSQDTSRTLLFKESTIKEYKTTTVPRGNNFVLIKSEHSNSDYCSTQAIVLS